MSELVYSKKQITPLITKFGIDVENDDKFKSIIELFSDQTPYQIWAIKAVYGYIAPIEKILEIKSWIDDNKNLIASLSKGNVVAYKTASDFRLLDGEMRGLIDFTICKEWIDQFNTRQREMLREHIIDDIHNGCDAMSSSRLKEWSKIFKNIATMPSNRIKNLINTSSAINNLSTLKNHIASALSAEYSWNKEDLLGFVARNANDCSIVYNVGNIVIVNVTSFESSKKLCGGGKTSWCLTRESSYFRQYVTDRHAQQYFFFDFSKAPTHPLSHIGFTVQPGRGITNAHATNNETLLGGMSIDGKRIDVHQALANAQVPTSVYNRLNPLVKYKWGVDEFLKYVGNRNGAVALCLQKDNLVVVRPLNNDMVNSLFDHTLIDKNRFQVNNKSKTYVMLDFNRDVSDKESFVAMRWVADIYGSETLEQIVDAYNAPLDTKKYLAQRNIDPDTFLNREKIRPEVMLHKYINEDNEEKALEIISDENVDVNFEFNCTRPIFNVISKKMDKLFKKIISHKKFDANLRNGMEEPVFQHLLYTYEENNGKEARSKKDYEYRPYIEEILKLKNYDFNAVDINEDSALSVACTKPCFSWVVEALVANPTVNPNIVNDFNCTALGDAIRHNNKEAIKLLATRPDVVLRKEDYELAESVGIDLKDYFEGGQLNPQELEVPEDLLALSEIFREYFSTVKA